MTLEADLKTLDSRQTKVAEKVKELRNEIALIMRSEVQLPLRTAQKAVMNIPGRDFYATVDMDPPPELMRVGAAMLNLFGRTNETWDEFRSLVCAGGYAAFNAQLADFDHTRFTPETTERAISLIAGINDPVGIKKPGSVSGTGTGGQSSGGHNVYRGSVVGNALIKWIYYMIEFHTISTKLTTGGVEKSTTKAEDSCQNSELTLARALFLQSTRATRSTSRVVRINATEAIHAALKVHQQSRVECRMKVSEQTELVVDRAKVLTKLLFPPKPPKGALAGVRAMKVSQGPTETPPRHVRSSPLTTYHPLRAARVPTHAFAPPPPPPAARVGTHGPDHGRAWLRQKQR